MNFWNKIIDHIFTISRDAQIFVISISAVIVAGLSLIVVLSIINSGGA